MTDQPISFGDNVRVRDTEVTRASDVAGLVGTVYGWTVPSSSGVEEVIGEIPDDFAVNVHFEERDASLWFALGLLEFVDHGTGAVITIDGADKKWTRTTSGDWEESPLNTEQESSAKRFNGKRLNEKQ
jgi:hypothetical protein